jgi:hypothetical protein
MTYAICNVVLGYEIPVKLRAFIEEVSHDFEDLGFKSFYSGNGEMPIYCGLKIGQFDECQSMTVARLQQIVTPNEKQLAQAQTIVEETRDKVQQFLDGYPFDPHPEDDDPLEPEFIQAIMKQLPVNPVAVLIWSTS